MVLRRGTQKALSADPLWSSTDIKQSRPEERTLRTSLEEIGMSGWVSRTEDLGCRTAI